MKASSLRQFLHLPFLPILVAPLVLFSPLLLTGKALFWGTPVLQFVPWWSWAWETLRAGHLPLWSPLLGMGAPLAANYQSALFYPPNWLYGLMAAFGGAPAIAWGQALLAALHLAWAGVGMILLARRLGLGVLSQAISGLAFSLSGYLVARAGFLSISAAVAWLPWILLFSFPLESIPLGGWRNADKFPVKQRAVGFSNFLKLAFALSMQLLAGHAQTAWYTWLLTGLWTAYWGWRTPVFPRNLGSYGRYLLGVGRLWLRLAAALTFAISLAAVQLLPTFEYLRQSQRATAVDYEAAMTYSFWPWRTLSLLAPDLFGNPASGDYWGYANYWEDAAYVGMLPLLLALAAVLRRKGGRWGPSFPLFLFLLGLLTFALALGKNTPLFPWLYRHVPTFDMFQAPSRYLLWLEVALALLAGLGAQCWRRPQGRALYWTRLGTMGAFAVSVGAGLAWFLMDRVAGMPEISTSFIRAAALAGMWGVGAGVLSLLAPAGEADVDGKASWRWTWAVVLFVAADLLFAGWGLNPGVDLDLYGDPPSAVSEVQALSGGHRLFLPEADEREIKFERFFRFDTFDPGEDWSRLRTVLLPNLNLFTGLPSANNFDPLVPGRYARWMEYLGEVDPETTAPLLNLMDVSLVERVDISQEIGVRFDLLSETAPARARWVPCSKLVKDEQAAWHEVTGGEVDFESVVVLEGGEEFADAACSPDSRGSLAWILDTPDRIEIRVSAGSPGWLVLSDVWYPGWRARADGEMVPILRANYLFRAVRVSAGEQRVVFEYRPASFGFGLALSALAWALFVWFRLKPKYLERILSSRSEM